VTARSISISILTAAVACLAPATAADNPSSPKLKEEMRVPWKRSNDRFLRRWVVLTDVPLAVDLDKDLAAVRPADKMAQALPNGAKANWRAVTSWGDIVDLSDNRGLKRDLAGYAYTTIERKQAGKALLLVGSDESVRVWVNGVEALDRRTTRQLTPDEDQVEVDLKAGENTLLLKIEQRQGPWNFTARVLEPGAVMQRVQEIGPSLMEVAGTTLVIKTDINAERAAQDKVTVQIIAAGGKAVARQIAARGATVRIDSAAWPAGPYEIRATTRKMSGNLFAVHIPWYKGDAIAAARALVAAAAQADARTPRGMTTRMLAGMVKDRLGAQDVSAVTGNPWWAIHSPLMEYEELKLEAAGDAAARVRSYGFLRLAYIDEVDGSPQFCRVYLPGGFDRTKKFPLVVKLHGFNPENPVNFRWWSADSRHHSLADVEYSNRQGVVYMEPHGRGNTTYLGFGDQDIVRVIDLAKKQLNIDPDRVYLTGDSMGGWGAWNVGMRHPDLFAALAPIFGGTDYHAFLSEEALKNLSALDRFLNERGSSWAMADAFLHMPILVHHGDVDRSVDVNFSRWGVRLLQRWGYNVRYVEMPGYAHEDLNAMTNIIEWFLPHRRVSSPARVRVRSSELAYASAYWVRIDQAATPMEFMVAEAEVVAPNVIRLDSQNAAALTLSPGAGLVDPAQPVKVVWNGEARSMKVADGRLQLRAAGYEPAPGEKNGRIAGPIRDIIATPFAIVVGTASTDPLMKEIVRKKADAVVGTWKEWQKQPPRVFQDSDLSDADATRYSLILVGGPAENLITRRLTSRLPLEIGADYIKVGSRSFPVTDGRVQMIFPSPLNPQRYVLVAAATSYDGMYYWTPGAIRNLECDFAIEDGRQAPNNRVSFTDVWVGGGWFNQRWQVDDALVFQGDAEVRAKLPAMKAPRPTP
jgi:pimeloyl-ACP methyl ester carboxylesterase